MHVSVEGQIQLACSEKSSHQINHRREKLPKRHLVPNSFNALRIELRMLRILVREICCLNGHIARGSIRGRRKISGQSMELKRRDRYLEYRLYPAMAFNFPYSWKEDLRAGLYFLNLRREAWGNNRQFGELSLLTMPLPRLAAISRIGFEQSSHRPLNTDGHHSCQ